MPPHHEAVMLCVTYYIVSQYITGTKKDMAHVAIVLDRIENRAVHPQS